jgi:hypothetical protein
MPTTHHALRYDRGATLARQHHFGSSHIDELVRPLNDKLGGKMKRTMKDCATRVMVNVEVQNDGRDLDAEGSQYNHELQHH